MYSLSDTDALQSFTTVWEHVECGICIIDAHTREILAINPVAARMFGDNPERMIGKRCHKFICPAETCTCPIMDKGQVVDRSERVFIRSDGTAIPIIKSVAKIQYAGRLALLESFTDISNLKEAQEKIRQLSVTEEANRAKGDFLSRMSHEMRTPMNAIIGMTKIADGTSDVSRLKYCLSMIGVSAQHLLELINDVLDISKIEAGKFELHSAPFNLEEMLIKICNISMEKAEENGIELRVVMQDAMPLDFVGDELRLSQVLTNILSNAVKFTPKGGSIVVYVDSPGTSDRENARLRIAVEDSGIGMKQEQMDRLFNAFEQADSSITGRFGGTGLGLAISKSIMEKMQGSIAVTSAPGEGTRFTIDLTMPLAPCPVSSLEQAAKALSGAKVLVASPVGDVLSRFAKIAARYDFQLEQAGSADAAADLMSAARRAGAAHRLVLLDYALVEKKGLPFFADLLPEAERDTLLLMASFLRWSAIEEQAACFGIRQFIPKPLFESIVLRAMHQVLSPRTEKRERETEDRGGLQADFSSLRLLLAEDVDINREIFAALLQHTGIMIDMAENGQEALSMVTERPGKYDLVVMDVQMPVMDGLEATRRIRALADEKARALPIIAMTANAFTEDIEKCLACGMNDHLAKPIDEVAVIAKIRKYCSAR